MKIISVWEAVNESENIEIALIHRKYTNIKVFT